jgi:hypothetical protein
MDEIYATRYWFSEDSLGSRFWWFLWEFVDEETIGGSNTNSQRNHQNLEPRESSENQYLVA